MKCQLLCLIMVLCFTSCGNAQDLVFESQDVVKGDASESDKDQNYSPEEINEIFSERNWEHLETTNRIKSYAIKQVIVNENPLEYARQLVFKKEFLNQDIAPILLEIKNPHNYRIGVTDVSGFNPTIQLSFCSEQCDLSLLIDTQNCLISFTNLAGQDYRTINQDLNEKISNTLIN